MKTLFPLPVSRTETPTSNNNENAQSATAAKNQSVVAERKLITFSQAAEQMSVSLNHVRNLIKDGHLTVVNVGTRSRRLRVSDIDNIVSSGVRQQNSKSR